MNAQSSQTHQMVLERTLENGEEEWFCPTCGRRLLFTWPPKYKRVILTPGDEYAVHSGGKGGVGMAPAAVIKQEEVLPVMDDRLRIWSDWMDQVDFDNLWREHDD